MTEASVAQAARRDGITGNELTQQALLHHLGKQDMMRHLMMSGLVITLLATMLTALSIGAVEISLLQVLAILASEAGISLPWQFDAVQQNVLLQIRLPRIALGILVGGGLAVSGAVMQGLFRNPLADPGLIGVSSGAALASVAVIVLGSHWLSWLTPAGQIYALPPAAFLGGVITCLVVYRFATHGGRTEVATLLLAGIAINAIAGAGTGILVYLADDAQLRSLTFWTMGGLGGVDWDRLMVAAPLMLAGSVMLMLFQRQLNAFLLGESEAFHLGFNIQQVKRILIVLVAVLVGTAVALSGVIGFVGLVVPHMLRLAAGPDHRHLLPGSILLGSTLLLLADIIARTLVAPAELPIGIITSALGGPFFLWLLARQGRRGRF